MFFILVGKWHLGHYCPQCLPQQRGFDSFYGYLTGMVAKNKINFDYFLSEFLPTQIVGAEDYYKKTFCIPLVPNQRPAACGYDFYSNTTRDPEANGTYSTYQFRDASYHILENHPKDVPLFLYLPFQSVHYPLMVPKNYSGKEKKSEKSYREMI